MSHRDQIEGADDRGRRWYRLRPEPRRGTDFMGLNFHMVDGAGMARPAPRDHLPVSVVVVT